MAAAATAGHEDEEGWGGDDDLLDRKILRENLMEVWRDPKDMPRADITHAASGPRRRNHKVEETVTAQSLPRHPRLSIPGESTEPEWTDPLFRHSTSRLSIPEVSMEPEWTDQLFSPPTPRLVSLEFEDTGPMTPLFAPPSPRPADLVLRAPGRTGLVGRLRRMFPPEGFEQ